MGAGDVRRHGDRNVRTATRPAGCSSGVRADHVKLAAKPWAGVARHIAFDEHPNDKRFSDLSAGDR